MMMMMVVMMMMVLVTMLMTNSGGLKLTNTVRRCVCVCECLCVFVCVWAFFGPLWIILNTFKFFSSRCWIFLLGQSQSESIARSMDLFKRHVLTMLYCWLIGGGFNKLTESTIWVSGVSFSRPIPNWQATQIHLTEHSRPLWTVTRIGLTFRFGTSGEQNIPPICWTTPVGAIQLWEQA